MTPNPPSNLNPPCVSDVHPLHEVGPDGTIYPLGKAFRDWVVRYRDNVLGPLIMQAHAHEQLARAQEDLADAQARIRRLTETPDA